jgi:hypothetical protein
MKIRVKYIFASLMLFSQIAYAQTPVSGDLKFIHAKLAELKNMTYDYSIVQTYPDNTVDKIKGKIISAQKLYWENTGYDLIMQSDKWYYRANHEDKTVYIVNIGGRQTKKVKNIESLTTFMPDLIYSKYGKTTSKTEGSVIKITIEFGPEVLVKKVYLEYDTKRNMPLLYQVELDRMYGIDGQNFDEKYLKQSFVATNFGAKSDKAIADLSSYFSYNEGKITLKKYTNYKLIQQL